jgi:putative transposase
MCWLGFKARNTVRYGVSYRDLEEIVAERGVGIDHATLNRWVVKFSLLIAENAQIRQKPTASSWRMPSRDITAQYPVR